MCRHLCKGSTSGAKHPKRPMLTWLTCSIWGKSGKFWQLHDTAWTLKRDVLPLKTNFLPNLSHILQTQQRYIKKLEQLVIPLLYPSSLFPMRSRRTAYSTALHSHSHPMHHNTVIPEQAFSLQGCWALPGHLTAKLLLPQPQSHIILQSTLTISLLSLQSSFVFSPPSFQIREQKGSSD